LANVFLRGIKIKTMNTKNNDRSIRQHLLEEAWQKSFERGTECPFVDLFVLVDCIKKSCIDNRFLSSLYFAGADVDHPYFLKNEAIAIGMAVFPEDAGKAGHPKRHPHQVEVVFVLQGSLNIFWGQKNHPQTRVLREGDFHVIEKDICHWFTPLDGIQSCYLFVKTNPVKEPRSIEG
jgi:quercetin dioxygenase-like cupin family protein